MLWRGLQLNKMNSKAPSKGFTILYFFLFLVFIEFINFIYFTFFHSF